MGRTEQRQGLAERLARKRPQTDTFTLVIDPDAHGRVERALDALERARLFTSTGGDVAQAQAELDEAQAHAEEVGAVEVLHLQAVPRPEYEQLLLQHPPTEQQKADGQTYDPDGFAPALVAASVVDPDTGERPLTVEQVTELWATWNQGEVFALWGAVLRLSTQSRNPAVPFGSGRTRG